MIRNLVWNTLYVIVLEFNLYDVVVVDDDVIDRLIQYVHTYNVYFHLFLMLNQMSDTISDENGIFYYLDWVIRNRVNLPKLPYW